MKTNESEKKSGSSYRDGDYETELGFLYREDGYSKISFPIRIRERHLTQGPSEAAIQAIGTHLQIAIWSERDNILIRLPLDEWEMSKPYERKLSGPNNGLLSVGRFDENLDDSKGEDGKILGRVQVHEKDRKMGEE